MFCFNLCLLIHNRTHLDCELSDVCFGSFDWRLSAGFFLRFPGDLAEGGQHLFYVMGWRDSHNFESGNNWETVVCVICQADLIGGFVFSLSLLLALSLWTQKTSHEINARQRKHLARWNYGEASGRWNFCFISFHCFPLSPIQALVGRRNIKGTALTNTTNKLLPHSLDWIERRFPMVRSLWVT